MLASDSETDSANWDSDTCDESGPLKQVWGSKDLKYKATSKFDFVSNPPQDGEEYLMAVLLERKKTPSCVAADKTKMEEIKSRKSAIKQGTTEGSSASGDRPSEQQGDLTLESKLEGLNLEEKSSEADTENKADVNELARFFPTAKWRENRSTQFEYIRIKMDLMRDQILQGKVYFLSSFTKFEKERMYWLRYCFGTQDATKMIEMKRAKKAKAKELYDAKKKLKSGEAHDSQDDSPDSDVEFITKEEVATLSQPDKSLDEIGSIKTISGSSDEGCKSAESAPDVQDSSLQPSAGEDSKGNNQERTDNSSTGADISGSTSQNDVRAESEGSTNNVAAEIPSTINLVQEQELSSKKADPASAVKESGAEMVVDEEFVDPIIEHRALHGHQPTTHLLLSMPQRLVEYLLNLQLNWLREFGFVNRKQGNWLYATMTSLQVPFEPAVISDLRQIALQCVQIRDVVVKSLDESQIPETEKAKEGQLNQPIYSLMESDEQFGLEDVVSSCNLFITLVVDFFVQKDLNVHLSAAGESDSIY